MGPIEVVKNGGRTVVNAVKNLGFRKIGVAGAGLLGTVGLLLTVAGSRGEHSDPEYVSVGSEGGDAADDCVEPEIEPDKLVENQENED